MCDLSCLIFTSSLTYPLIKVYSGNWSSFFIFCHFFGLQSLQFLMLWHVLRQTFIDLPSSAISSAKRCSVLHRSGPAPTRHECQIGSKVNFLLLTLYCCTFQYFPFNICKPSNCFFLVSGLFYCRFSTIIRSEVNPLSPVRTAAAVLEMSLIKWAWVK